MPDEEDQPVVEQPVEPEGELPILEPPPVAPPLMIVPNGETLAQMRALYGLDNRKKKERIARLLAPYYEECRRSGIKKPFTVPPDPEDPRPAWAAAEKARKEAEEKEKEEAAVDQQTS